MNTLKKTKPSPSKTASVSEETLKCRIESVEQEFASAFGWFGLKLKTAEFDGLVRAYAADKPLAIEAITKIIVHRLRLDFNAKEREENDVVDNFF